MERPSKFIIPYTQLEGEEAGKKTAELWHAEGEVPLETDLEGLQNAVAKKGFEVTKVERQDLEWGTQYRVHPRGNYYGSPIKVVADIPQAGICVPEGSEEEFMETFVIE